MNLLPPTAPPLFLSSLASSSKHLHYLHSLKIRCDKLLHAYQSNAFIFHLSRFNCHLFKLISFTCLSKAEHNCKINKNDNI